MDFIGRVSGIDFQGIDKVAGEQNYIVGVLAKNASSLTKKKKKKLHGWDVPCIGVFTLLFLTDLR